MRFLKKQQINFRNVSDDGIAFQITGEVTMDTENVLLVPKGPLTMRPGELNTKTLPVNGHIRYNTTLDQFEVYQANAWRALRFKEPTTVTQQNLGPGDSVQVYFGPLNPPPPEVSESGGSWGPQNLIVLIENVFQISVTNYTVVQLDGTTLRPPESIGEGTPYNPGWYIKFEGPVPYGKPVTVLHGFDR